MNICDSCKFANRHSLAHRELILCSAPQLARDPVTGEVVVGARYARGDASLCTPEGRWYAVRVQPQRRLSVGWPWQRGCRDIGPDTDALAYGPVHGTR